MTPEEPNEELGGVRDWIADPPVESMALLAEVYALMVFGRHDQVSEVYYIIEGEGTIIVGPDLINPVKRADDEKTVRLQNGPGWNADGIRNPQEHHLKAGDMLVIPAGTGHLFTEVPGDHITYVMVRIDPDKVVPTKSKEQSDADLKAPPEPASPRNQLKGR